MQFTGNWQMWLLGGLTFFLLIVAAMFVFSLVLRRYLGRRERPAAGSPADAAPVPRSENEPAFLAASMQAVIQKLREQEKELERLHRSERERAAETERLTEAVLRNMPTGLLLVNSAGLITVANPAAEETLGLGALAYRRFGDVLGANSPLAHLLERCLAEGRTYQREEIQHITASGAARQLGVTMSPILPPPAAGAAPGKISGALCLLSDLTELTALQHQVRLKENLAALGEMSAGIAHEFKNALATISGYAQMLRSEAVTPDQKDSAEHILAQTLTLTHVVTEFLRYARPFELDTAAVSLSRVAERAAAEIRDALPGVRLEVEGEFAEVPGDEALLRQALLNLLRNAAQAAAGRPGAVVQLRGTTGEAGGLSVQQITVTDNGPGIAAEDLPKIFLPFYTTKTDGTGLGLAIVQKIVLQHGGGVEARNLPEGGAEFRLWLPLRRPANAEAVDSATARI
jgi:two-component system nitrogen regulation sensor histidine kinase GlnL